MPDPTWQSSLDVVRALSGVPAAQANVATLARARARWQFAVIARTSMHDLLFTLPGDGYPFAASVRVRWDNGDSTVLRWQGDQLVEETTAGADDIDALLDAFLERLTQPALTCRRCGLAVTVSAAQFDVFERMHYSCFHYVFEHDPFDPDEECSAGGCPSAAIGPTQRPEEPRDSLVEEMIDGLVTSKLGARSTDVRIEREGPGTIRATLDGDHYLITVRTAPPATR
jgi:hypothetical protein